MGDQQAVLESDLIFQAKNGNEDAFGVLYQRHVDAIYAYIHKRVSSVCEAEDLSQTVFLKAWQAIYRYQPSTTPFRAWLYRIAHNTVIDHYRTQKKSVQWEDLSTFSDPASTPESALLETERQETVHRAVATLRPSYRDVIIHRFLESKDYSETADLLNRQVNNVRVLQHRALGALRRTLSQESAIWIALVATALTFFFGTTIVEAASRALPDERLYPLRTFVEDAHLAIADDAADIRLHAEFADRRLANLETLTAEEQAEQDRIEALEATVTELSSHIAAASDKLDALPGTEADIEAIGVELGQLLDDQSALLAELESKSAPAIQEIMQPAFEAVDEARQRLGRGAQPARPETQPAAPDEEESRELSSNSLSDSASLHLPASHLPDEATVATTSAPAKRQEPAPSNWSAEDDPFIALPEARSEPHADRESSVNGTRERNQAVSGTTTPNEDGETIEPLRAAGDEAASIPEPRRVADGASSESSSESRPAQEIAEQRKPSRQPQERPSSPEESPSPDQPVRPPGLEEMQSAGSMAETVTP